MSDSPAIAEDIAQGVFLSLLPGEVEVDRSRGSPRASLQRRWNPLDDEAFVPTPTAGDGLGQQQAVATAIAALPREALIKRSGTHDPGAIY